MVKSLSKMHSNHTLNNIYSNSGSKSKQTSLIQPQQEIHHDNSLINDSVNQSPNLNKDNVDDQFEKELKKYEEVKISMLYN